MKAVIKAQQAARRQHQLTHELTHHDDKADVKPDLPSSSDDSAGEEDEGLVERVWSDVSSAIESDFSEAANALS